MPIRAFCPSCRAEFHLQEDSAGTKVRCGTCLNVFEVPLDAPPVATQAPPVPTATRAPDRPRGRRDDDYDRRRRPRRDEDDDYDYERPSLNRRRSRKPDNTGRTVLLVIGLVFGIKFAMIALIVFFALVMSAVAPPQPAPPGAWDEDPGPVFVNNPGPAQWQPAPQPQPWQPQQPQFNRPGWQPPQPQPVAPRPPVAPVGPKGFR